MTLSSLVSVTPQSSERTVGTDGGDGGCEDDCGSGLFCLQIHFLFLLRHSWDILVRASLREISTKNSESE